MKIYYTFLIIMILALSGYAQDNVSTAEKQNSSFTSNFNAPTFSINKVYPNPVKDFVILDIQSDKSGNVQFSLINILGSEVKKWEPKYLAGGDQKIKLDLSAFQTGIYFLRLTKSNQVVTQVLKKN